MVKYVINFVDYSRLRTELEDTIWANKSAGTPIGNESAVVDMNDPKLWSQGQHAMNKSRHWTTWATMSLELKVLMFKQLIFMYDMNSGSCDLRALDAMNNLGLWLTWTTLDLKF